MSNFQTLMTTGGLQLMTRSLRFRESVVAGLTRSFAVGNQILWTFSFWIKRCNLDVPGNSRVILTCGPTLTTQEFFIYYGVDTLSIFNSLAGVTNVSASTVGLFRDVGAWYHCVVNYDSAQAVAANRIRMYVNGVLQTLTVATAPTASLVTNLNSATTVHIGRRINSTLPVGSYLAELNFIDGQSLDASNFGLIDSNTGVWAAKPYAGTYGTTGFRLDFSDNSTTTTLGLDRSGLGNNWTPSNLSVTPGATNDSLVESPAQFGADTAAGGEVRGNYVTFNPLFPSGGVKTFTNGNLTVVGGVGGGSNSTERLTVDLIESGQWFLEATCDAIGANTITGIGAAGWIYQGDGTNIGGATFTTGDIIGLGMDIAAGTLKFYKNGTIQATKTFTAGAAIIALFQLGGAAVAPGWTLNTGQRPWAFPANAVGYKAMCTTNMPTPTVVKSNTFFDVNLRTGTGAAFNVTGKALLPDLIWSKRRDVVASHFFNSPINGVSNGLTDYISTDLTSASIPTAQGTTAYNADGFSGGTLAPQLNTNTGTYVDWMWKLMTTGYDRVTIGGTGANRTIAHALGVVPEFILIKNISSVADWVVYHKNMNATPQNGGMALNTTAAFAADATLWNSTAPTSAVVSLGTSGRTNATGNALIMHLFASVPGFSKFGSYTGNNSTDGPFVYCGFRPRYILIRQVAAVDNWILMDSARDVVNTGSTSFLQANITAIESSLSVLDILSNGFKSRSTNLNSAAAVYAFAAFAETPFKNTLAR